MRISASDAKSVLHEAHSSWSRGDVEGTLAYYSDDLLYICNKGGIDGSPLAVSGKEHFRDFLLPIMETVDISTAVQQFQFEGQIGRALIGCHIRHRETGITHLSDYMQIMRFRNSQISRMFELHSLERMTALWQFVLCEEEAPHLTIAKPTPPASDQDWRKQLPPNWYRKG